MQRSRVSEWSSPDREYPHQGGKKGIGERSRNLTLALPEPLLESRERSGRVAAGEKPLLVRRQIFRD